MLVGGALSFDKGNTVQFSSPHSTSEESHPTPQTRRRTRVNDATCSQRLLALTVLQVVANLGTGELVLQVRRHALNGCRLLSMACEHQMLAVLPEHTRTHTTSDRLCSSVTIRTGAAASKPFHKPRTGVNDATRRK